MRPQALAGAGISWQARATRGEDMRTGLIFKYFLATLLILFLATEVQAKLVTKIVE